MRLLHCFAILLCALAPAQPSNQLFDRNANVCPYPRPTETVYTTVTVFPGADEPWTTQNTATYLPATIVKPSSSSSARYSKPAGPAVTLVPTVHWSQDTYDLNNLVPNHEGKVYSSNNGTNG